MEKNEAEKLVEDFVEAHETYNPAKKTIVIVQIDNEQEATVQMGQRYWLSMLREVNFLLRTFDVTQSPFDVPAWHTAPNDSEQSAIWRLTVQEDRIPDLKRRVQRLIASPPYQIRNGASILVAHTA